ncbi:MAG TPA: hypothetical protein ENI48_03070 [Thioploca sp.]|nr:hypothetical protein [Thioploca sp.]
MNTITEHTDAIPRWDSIRLNTITEHTDAIPRWDSIRLNIKNYSISKFANRHLPIYDFYRCG